MPIVVSSSIYRLGAALAVAVGVHGPAQLVRADEAPVLDLIATSSTEVFADPAEGSVDVIHRYRFQNTTLGETFAGFFETIPRDALELNAEANGRGLDIGGGQVRGELAERFVAFPEPLDAGEEVDVEVRWSRQGLDSLPNDEDLLSPNLVAFAPFAVGHRGTASLTVRIAGEFDVVESSGLDVEVVDAVTVLRGNTVAAYERQLIVLEVPDRFVRSRIDRIDLDITVASPVAVDGWLVTELRAGVAALADWIPLNPPEPIEFRQGWTGDESSRVGGDDALVVSPDVAPFDVLTIVADRWLADIAFTDTELRLGLAASIAGQASDPVRTHTIGVTTWSRATDALVEVDPERFASALVALAAGTPAYAGTAEIDIPSAVDWRRVLDVFEHVAGVSRAPAAFELSVGSDSLGALLRRKAALVEYRALSDRAAPWILPPLLRGPMSAWDFESFFAQQGSVSDLIAARDEMQAEAEESGLEIGGDLKGVFEAASVSMDPVWELFDEQRETLDTVAEAQRFDIGDRGLLSAIGMIGSDSGTRLAAVIDSWDAGEFSMAAQQAEALIDEYEGAVGRGTLRLIVPAGFVVLVVAGWRALRRRCWITP